MPRPSAFSQGLDLNITVKGAKEVERALDKVDEDAEKAVIKEKRRLAKNLAAKLRRAVISGTKVSRQTSPGRRPGRGRFVSHRPMGIRVRPTIKQSGIKVTAGPHPMLYGTEFGMNKKSGWYGRPEFASSPHLQYFRHNNAGYWWNPTIQRSKPEADAAVKRALDDALSHWSA